MSARFALKAETDSAHERLDQRMARLNLSDRADYSTFLAVHGAVLPGLEKQLEAGGLGAVVPLWLAHRRAGPLALDLAAMGIVPPVPIAVPVFASPEAMLGAAYVLEGSRLGGQLLAKQVPDGFPAAFLRDQGNIAPWRELVAALDGLLTSPGKLSQAKAAALDVFDAYSEAASRNGLN